MASAAPTSAMRRVFWWLGLAALAVASALMVGSNQAVLSLFWPPHRLDISFNFALFAAFVLFVLIYLALRTVSVLRELPARAQRWRAQQVERAAVGALLDALSYQLSGRFVRAQASAQAALDHAKNLSEAGFPQVTQLQLLAHLLVAESAQSLRKTEVRDQHLQLALAEGSAKSMSPAHEGVLLRAAHWAIEDRDAVVARQRLAELPTGAARRIQALRLRLRASRLDRSAQEALETARVLAKYRAFSPEAARSIVQGLLLDALRQAHDVAQLRALWAPLSSEERQRPELALVAAQRVREVVSPTPDAAPRGADNVPDETSWRPGSQADPEAQQAAALVREWLDPLWAQWPALTQTQQRQMASILEAGLPHLDGPGLAQLEQTQRQWPNNAYLQYLAGQAFRQRQLWGKAAQLLTQASHSLQDAGLLRKTWRALAALAEERGDPVAAHAAWKRAAQFD